MMRLQEVTVTLAALLGVLAAILVVVSGSYSGEQGRDRNEGRIVKGLYRPHKHASQQPREAAGVQKPVTFLKPPPEDSSRRHRAPAVNRKSRFLSMFTVVNFENMECRAESGDNGTCLATTECLGRGGVASGACAGGFGVCCVFMVTCGQTTSQNTTYFVNSGYPSPYDETGYCQLTVQKHHPDICQLRLDFDLFMIGGPEMKNHVCNNDQFIVSGGSPVPAICGTNTGDHMYVDAGVGINSPVTLTFVTNGPSFPRNWKVRISQIPCNSYYKADDGCLQYHTGVTGHIRSFNYNSGMGLQLSNQDYSICIRMERNFCGIQYTAMPDPANNKMLSFSLSGETAAPTKPNNQQDDGGKRRYRADSADMCKKDWLMIPFAMIGSRTSEKEMQHMDRICDVNVMTDISSFSDLNRPGAVSPISAPIFSHVRPFRLIFHTDGDEKNDKGNRGFALHYIQQPCTNVLN